MTVFDHPDSRVTFGKCKECGVDDECPMWQCMHLSVQQPSRRRRVFRRLHSHLHRPRSSPHLPAARCSQPRFSPPRAAPRRRRHQAWCLRCRRRCARSTSIRMLAIRRCGVASAPPHSHSRRTTARRCRRRAPSQPASSPSSPLPAPASAPHPSPSPGGPPRTAAAKLFIDGGPRLPAAGARAVVRAGRWHDGAAPDGRAPAAAEAGDRVHAADVDLPGERRRRRRDFDAFWRTMQGKEKWPSLGGGGCYHRMAGRWPPPGAAASVRRGGRAGSRRAARRRAGRRRGAAKAEARPGGAGAHRAVGDAVVPVGGDGPRPPSRSSRGTTRESASPPARRRRRRRSRRKRRRPGAARLRRTRRRRRRSRPPSRSSRGTTAGSGCEREVPRSAHGKR